MKKTSNSVIKNFFWRFAERCGAKLVSFLVSIILARLLAPDDYGVVALITVFTSILNVFVDSGFANSLIQKKDADDLDFSTVFYSNVLFCVLLYIIIFFMAPFISEFYNRQDMTPYIRVLGITVIISGLKNVQQAYVSRNMMFKKFFYATLGGTVAAATAGILMAYLGYGIWALIAQQLVNVFLDTVILWITVGWRPKKMFSVRRLKGLFSFGSKLLASNLLSTIYNNLQSLLIGKFYTSSDLAFYNQGEKMPNMLVTNIDSSINSVLLPAMADAQDDKLRVKHMTQLSVKISSYIMAPLMIGLMVVSKNLVTIILTEKWLECVPFMYIFCLIYMFSPIHNANLTAINALGRSDMFLKAEILKKIVGCVILCISIKFGVFCIALGLLLSSMIALVINVWPNKKLIEYTFSEQMLDIFPNILIAGIMGVVIYPISLLGINGIICIIIQVVCGIIIFILLSYIFKNKAFLYIMNKVKTLRKGRT